MPSRSSARRKRPPSASRASGAGGRAGDDGGLGPQRERDGGAAELAKDSHVGARDRVDGLPPRRDAGAGSARRVGGAPVAWNGRGGEEGLRAPDRRGSRRRRA